MTLLDAITEAYLLTTKKATPPAVGTAKRSQLTSLAIKFYRDWQTEPGMEWDSLYEVMGTTGTGLTTATDTFTLDAAVHFLPKGEQLELNCVRVRYGDADAYQYRDYTIVKPSQLHLNRLNDAVALISPTQIKFSRAFTEDDPDFGGTLEVPVITKLTDLSDDDDEILIDQPKWLAERVAAQYALSYKSLRSLYPDLLDLANETMTSMKLANGTGNESTSTGVDYFAGMGNVGITN